MPHNPSAGYRMARFALLFAAFFFFAGVAHSSPASEITVTLLFWNHGQIQVQEENGQVLKITTTQATWILRRGLPASARDFGPGETLQIRRGRGAGGTTRALLVCDLETAVALAGVHGHPLVGTLLRAEDKVWILQPEDGVLPLPVCLSAHTTFRAGEASVSASAFTAGARVTIQTRGLPNGLPSAVSITDGMTPETSEPKKETLRPRKTFSGTIVEARPDLGWLTLQAKNGFFQTVAVDPQTLIKIRTRKGRRSGTWDDLTVGRHIFARFTGIVDSVGNPLAATLSVSDP